MQLLGEIIGGMGLLAAIVLHHPLDGAIGLGFGILFLLVGIAGARFDER